MKTRTVYGQTDPGFEHISFEHSLFYRISSCRYTCHSGNFFYGYIGMMY